MKTLLNQSMLDKLNKKYANVTEDSSNRAKITYHSLSGYGRYIFRLIPLNKDSNGMLGKFVGSHFNMPADSKGRTFVPCVEAYENNAGAICPVCEALRELKNKGIDTESLWKNKVSAQMAIKVLMISTPKSEQEGKALPCEVSIFKVPVKAVKSLVDYYQDPLTPDLLDPNVGCALVFSRKQGEKSWSLSYLDSSLPQSGMLGGSEENRDLLLKQSDDINLDNIFKLPTDDMMLQIKNTATLFKESILKAQSDYDKPVVDMMVESGAVLKEQAPAYTPLPVNQPVMQQAQQPTWNQPNMMNIPIVNPNAGIPQSQSVSDDEIPFNQAVPQVQQVVQPTPVTTAPTIKAVEVVTPVQPQPVVIEQQNVMSQPNIQMAYATNPVDIVEVPLPTPVVQTVQPKVEQQIVQPVQTVQQPVVEQQPQVVSTPAPVAAPVVNSELGYPTSVPGIDENNFTPQQKAILDKYRDKCTFDCFGCLSKYNLKGKDMKCMKDPYSANCATAIQELYGVNVPLAF